jgi:hypothetical protein
MSNYSNMPPGADADLLRIEREQEELEKRLAEMGREMRDDPQVIIDNLDEDEIARRLLRMLTLARDMRRGKYILYIAENLSDEWEAAITEATANWRKSEGIET